MRIETIKARIKKLEQRKSCTPAYVVCINSDGAEEEILLSDWLNSGLQFLRFGRGYDPSFCDLDLFIQAIDKESDE